jgi:hypothetical protein
MRARCGIAVVAVTAVAMATVGATAGPAFASAGPPPDSAARVQLPQTSTGSAANHSYDSTASQAENAGSIPVTRSGSSSTDGRPGS